MRLGYSRPGVHRERGAALVITLLLLVPMSMVALSGMQSRVLEQRMAGNFEQYLQAQSIADSGIQAALDLLERPCGVEDGFNDELQTNGGVMLNDVSLGQGAYTVTALNNSAELPSTDDVDRMIVLSSTGTVGNVTETLAQVVRRNGTNLDFAILTQGNLTIEGNPTLTGCLVNVHANGDLHVDSGTLEGIATSTGTTTVGSASIDGGVESGAGAITVPNVDPTSFTSDATFTLTSAGEVLDSTGVVIDDGTAGNWNGWSHSGGQWTLMTDTPPPMGIYYVEGSAAISGLAGWAPVNTWEATVIAEQNISVDGYVRMESYDSTLQLGDVQNLALVSGADVQINGIGDQSVEGALAAAEQVEVLGNPTINGSVIAKGNGNSSTLVTDNLISGAVSLSNSVPTTPTGGIAVETLAWRR